MTEANYYCLPIYNILLANLNIFQLCLQHYVHLDILTHFTLCVCNLRRIVSDSKHVPSNIVSINSTHLFKMVFSNIALTTELY